MSGYVVGLGVIMSLAAACGEGSETSVDTGADVEGETAVGPPVLMGGASIYLVPGQLVGLRVGVVEGVAESLTIASAPEGITASLDRSDPRDSVRGIVNLRLAVAPDAAFGMREIELVARGPGGEGRASTWVEIGPTADPSGFVIGVGAAEVSLLPGDVVDVPLRVSSHGGWSGPVLVWVEPAARVEAFDVELVDHALTVTPDAPGETVLRLVARQADEAGDVSMRVRASSGRAQPSAWTTGTGELSVLYAATPDLPRLWLGLAEGSQLVVRAGETVAIGFDAWGDHLLDDPPTVVATAPTGWTANVEPGVGQFGRLVVSATASAPEGGVDLPIVATTPAGGRWQGVIRLVRPPTSGAWRFAGDGPLEAPDEAGAELVWDGVNRVPVEALVRGGAVDGAGFSWAVQGGAALSVLRAGSIYDELDVGGRRVIQAALVAQGRDEVVVACACGGTSSAVGAILLFRHVKAGLFEIEWEVIEPLVMAAGDLGALGLAAVGREVTVMFAHDDALRVQVHDGAAWQDMGIVGSLVSPPGRGGLRQAALTLDDQGRPTVAWIDGGDGSARVVTWTGSAWGEVGAPIQPSAERLLVALDVVTIGGREIVLLHEAPDLTSWLHPGVGASPRLRVLARDEAGWVELPDVTLPDVWWAPIETALARGDDGATWVGFDAWAARLTP